MPVLVLLLALQQVEKPTSLGRFIPDDAVWVVHVPRTDRVARRIDDTVLERLRGFPGAEELEKRLEDRWGFRWSDGFRILGMLKGEGILAVSRRDVIAVFDTGFPVNLLAPMTAEMLKGVFENRRERIGGVPVYRLSGLIRLYLASPGRYFVIATRRDAMRSILSRVRGKDKEAALESFASYRAALDGLQEADLRWLVRPRGLMGCPGGRWMGVGVRFDKRSLRWIVSCPE